MLEKQVLAGSATLGLLFAVLGAVQVALSLLSEPYSPGLLIGLLWLMIGAVHLAARHTVLDAVGITPAGALRRRTPWREVVDVRRSTTAMHYADVELRVRGRRRPIFVPERRGGADLEAVRCWWQAATAAEPSAPEPRPQDGPAPRVRPPT